MAIRYGTGKHSIEIDDGIEKMIRRVIDDAFPGVADAIERTTDELYQDAFDAWPVKSGRSKAALTQTLTIDGDTIRRTVLNPAKKAGGFPYVFAIRTKQQDGDENLWGLLIRKPGRKAGELLAEELGPVLAAIAEGD